MPGAWRVEIWNARNSSQKAVLEEWDNDSVSESLQGLGSFRFRVGQRHVGQIGVNDIVRLMRDAIPGTSVAESRFFWRVSSLRTVYADEIGFSLEVTCEALERDLRDVLYFGGGYSRVSARYESGDYVKVALDWSLTEAGSTIVYRFEGHPTIGCTLDANNVEPTTRIQLDLAQLNCYEAFNALAERAGSDVSYEHVFSTNVASYFDVKYPHFTGRYAATPFRVDRAWTNVSQEEGGNLDTAVFGLGASSGWRSVFSGIGMAVTGGTRQEVSVSASDVDYLRLGDHVQIWTQPFTTVVASAVNSPPLSKVYVSLVGGLTDGSLAGGHLVIYDGTGVGQTFPVLGNVQNAGPSTTEIQLQGVLPRLPDTTSRVMVAASVQLSDIEGFNGLTDAASSGGTRFIQGRTTVSANRYDNGWLWIEKGTGAGQVAQVQVNDTSVYTVTAAMAFGTAPDASSVFRVTATPFGSDGTVTLAGQDREVTIESASGDHLWVGLPEQGDPLEIGKTMPYRTVIDSVSASGLAVYTKSAYGSLGNWSHTGAYPHAVRLLESHIGSIGMFPVPSESLHQVNSVDVSNGVLYVYNAVTMPWTTNTRVELLAWRNATASTSFGVREAFVERSDLVTPQELAYALRERLWTSARGTRTYDMEGFDWGLYDPARHAGEAVSVGDVLPTFGASVVLNAYTFVGSTQGNSATGNSVYVTAGDYLTNSLRGHVLTFSGTTAAFAIQRNGAREIWFSNPDSVTLDSANAGWFTVEAGLRVVEQEWKPSEPGRVRWKVSNSPPPRKLLTTLSERVNSLAMRAQARRNRDAQRHCVHWDDGTKSCQRRNPPNVFCETSASNRDGRWTAQLRPITRGHCAGFFPVEEHANVLQATGTLQLSSVGATAGWTEATAGALRTYLVDADGAGFRVREAQVFLEEVVKTTAPNYATDYSNVSARVKRDASGFVVPASVSVQEGFVIQFSNASADTVHLYLRWLAFGTRL